jgi:hypothetical protein
VGRPLRSPCGRAAGACDDSGAGLDCSRIEGEECVVSRVVPSQVVSFIDEVFPTARSESRLKVHADKAPVLLGILDLVKNIPAELIQLSGSEYTDFIMGVSGLEHIVRTWETRGHGTSPPDRIKGTHPVVLLRRAMAMCPDEAPSATTADLLFIDDLHYRENIRNDVSGAGKALHNGEWKAATVLAGSALEALLLWAIQSKSSLEQLVTASEALEPTSKPKSIN